MTAQALPPALASSRALTKVYVSRAVVAGIWAAIFVASAGSLGFGAGALLVLYPLIDVGASWTDARTTGSVDVRATQRINAVISLIAAVALLAAATVSIPAVLRVFGVWAVVSGAFQLVVVIRRRRTAGPQSAIVVSGVISVLAGIGFAAMASADDPKLRNLAGYAALGAVLFLASAVLLRRKPRV